MGLLTSKGISESSIDTQNKIQRGFAADNMADSVSLSWNEIGNVKAMVEKCMQQYMTQAEIIATLQTQAGVQPSVTCLVWQKLEEQNQSFFYSYNAMLRVKDQLSLFNYLVDQQSCVVKASAPPAPNNGL